MSDDKKTKKAVDDLVIDEPVALQKKDIVEVIDIVNELKKQVADYKSNTISQEEFEAKGEELILKAVEESKKAATLDRERKISFETRDQTGNEVLRKLKSAILERPGERRDFLIADALQTRTKNEDINALKNLGDDMLIVDALMTHKKGYKGMESLDLFRRFGDMRDAIMKAVAPMDTVDTADWVPTAVSSEVIDLPYVTGSVEPLFRHIFCPTKSYPFPLNLNGADVLGSFVPESTTMVNPFDDTSGQTITDSNMTFAAKKVRSRLIWSGELSEDSIVPLLPTVKEELKKIQDRSFEAAILSGDTTATHMDADITDAKDPRKMLKGLRYHGLNGGSGALKVDLGTFNIANLRSIRGKMGAYGIYPSNLAWVLGLKTYLNLFLNLTEVSTVDKMGAKAIILTGQLAALDGIPIVLSEHQREALNAAGVQDGVTETDSVPILVNKGYWFVGDRRYITVESERWINTDQTNIVSFRRVDFQPIQTPDATYSAVACGYNCTV